MRGQLLDQSLHVGVPVRVELPAGDTQVKAQPGRVTVAAAVPLDIFIALLTRTDPAKSDEEEAVNCPAFTGGSSQSLTLKNHSSDERGQNGASPQ